MEEHDIVLEESTVECDTGTICVYNHVLKLILLNIYDVCGN